MTTQQKRILGFSDLQAYQQCPRRWALNQSWQSPIPPYNMLRGLVFHDIVSQFYDSKYTWSIEHHIPGFDTLRPDEVSDMKECIAEAKTMASAYLNSDLPIGVKSIMVNQQLEFKDSIGDVFIGGHPDIVAEHKSRLVLFELKTGDRLSPETINMSGQMDYYALLYEAHSGRFPDYIYIDCVDAKGFTTRAQRKPNRAAGEYILYQLQAMASLLHPIPPLGIGSEGLKSAIDIEQLYLEPHYNFWCGYCDKIKVSQAMDRGDDWQDMLNKYFIPRKTLNH